jgi:hypothetical protein
LGKGKRRWLVSHIILIVLGGAAIRKLEMKSHCSIKLDVGEPSSNFKICKIRGMPEHAHQRNTNRCGNVLTENATKSSNLKEHV